MSANIYIVDFILSMTKATEQFVMSLMSFSFLTLKQFVTSFTLCDLFFCLFHLPFLMLFLIEFLKISFTIDNVLYLIVNFVNFGKKIFDISMTWHVSSSFPDVFRLHSFHFSIDSFRHLFWIKLWHLTIFHLWHSFSHSFDHLFNVASHVFAVFLSFN